MSINVDDFTKNLINLYANNLSQQEQLELLKALEIVANDEKYNRFRDMFPVIGEYSRDKYPKHIEILNASSLYRELAMLGGNRSGKTRLGAYITTMHATGIYPDWYTGKRFSRPTLIWAGGDTATTCRDIIQFELLGQVGDFGSGMIPKDNIIETKSRRNVPDAVETIRVKHITGGVSTIVLKTYEQGRETWQGTAIDFAWIDEECPHEVYTECLMRTMTTNGYVFTTFTPLSGITDLVKMLMENDQRSGVDSPKFVMYVSWDDVGHLSERVKADLFAAMPPHERDARSKGIPTIGTGKIYPVAESDFVIDPIQLPKHFPRCYGLDVGWNMTAAVWIALDRDTDVAYLYDEYYRGEAEPAIHSSAIRARGEWINGVIDPASRGRNQHDGTKLFEKYSNEGLKITKADNAVEAGIYEVWQRLSTGRLKVFSTCTNWIKEFRLYRRDDKGRIVKKNDHGLDATRYAIMSGLDRATLYVEGMRSMQRNKVIPLRPAAWS